MFEGFREDRIDTGESSVFVRHGGEGPPVVLLHGHPRTSATWHRVAPRLVQRGFTVFCPDLPGYGRSRAPAPTADLEDYRAGLTVDRQDEEADRAAGRRVRPPLLVLWSKRDDLEDLHGDPLVIWRAWADDVRGHGIDSGHHMAEEAPEALARSLGGFFLRQ